MDKKVKILIFSIILLSACFLRFYRISGLPPSLNWDEVSIGYNAYSILKTGKDEWGKFLPLSFRAFGDYKLPAYVYLDAPFVMVFGLTELGVRLPSVLAGIGIVILFYLIIYHLTKDTFLSLTGMFLASILPWLIIFSRVALEANLALFLSLAAFYFFLLSFKKKLYLALSAIFLGLSLFSYNSVRVLIFPFLLLILILFRNELSKNRSGSLVAGIIIFAFIAIALPLMLFSDSSSRYRWTTILDEGATGYINQQRGNTDLPPVLSSLIYNKGTYFLTEATKNYLFHFSADFLFFNGGSNYQFSVPGTGQVYLVMLPFILLGIWQTMKQRKNWQLFILGWMLIAPIPGAITRDAPHSLRTIFLTIPLLISSVMGIKCSKDFLPAKIFHPLSVLIVLVLLGSTYMFFQNYTGDYRKDYSWSWQYGYKQAIDFVKSNQEKYDRIVFTKKYGEPHIFALFYLGYDPNKYQSDKTLVRYKRSDWFWVDRFGKFEFVDDGDIKDKVSGMKNTLLITSPDNYPANSQILDTINFLDGQKAFEVVVLR